MATDPAAELTGLLGPGEELIGGMPAQGFLATKRVLYPSNPQVVVTDRRIILLSRKGVFSKRLKEESSWHLDEFIDRMNSSEGSALGSFMYVMTLFTSDEGMVAFGFKRVDDRERYKSLLIAAFA
jgi:hypothetical protein